MKELFLPRIHVTPDKIVYLETDKFPVNQKENLINSGFVVEQPPSEIIVKGLNPYFGGVNAIANEKGEWKGAADPRRDGTIGYSH